MILDPAAQAVLDAIAEAGKGESEPTDDAERLEKARRDAAALGRFSRPAPTGVARRDIDVPASNGSVPVRLYTPDGADRPRLLVWFHGGGTIAGSLDTHEPVLMALAAATGRAVASVGYTLAPEAVFPAQHEECQQVAAWLAREAGALGLNPASWAVGGDSVGGLYAAATSRTLRDQGFAPMPAAQILAYPNTDLREDRRFASLGENEGRIMTRASLGFEARTAVPDPADRAGPRASPLLADDLTGLPATLLITAEADPLRDEGERYGERLREAGVRVEAVRRPGMIHAFLQMNAWIPDADAAMREIGDFLAEF